LRKELKENGLGGKNEGKRIMLEEVSLKDSYADIILSGNY
jgi:hypothetical protein